MIVKPLGVAGGVVSEDGILIDKFIAVVWGVGSLT
jgi:hypothetical protein